MAGKTIEAAGGIVVRKGAGRLIAVVQRSKDDAWVLPRGKLKRDENPVAGARREVVEETGHRVEVHEYLGAITYRAGGRPKVVQFWRMEADAKPSHELMSDISAVEWLPLKAAVRRLSYPLEKLFLRHAAARAIKKRRADKTARKATGTKSVKRSKVKLRKADTKKAATKKAALKNKSGKGKTKPKNRSKDKAGRKRRDKAGKKDRPGRAARKAATKATRKNIAKPKDVTRPKKDKGKKADRKRAARDAAAVRPDTAVQSFAGDSARPAPTNVASLPIRAEAPPKSGAHKTILQRMLGRLAG